MFDIYFFQIKVLVLKSHNYNCLIKLCFYAGLINNQTVVGSGWEGLYIALTDRGRELHDFQWQGWPDLFEWNLDWAPSMVFVFA